MFSSDTEVMNCRYFILGSTAVVLFSSLCALRPSAARSEEQVSGKAIFAEDCSACHGIDGRGGERAPNITTRREVVSLTDADLIRVVQKGVPGTAMPGFDDLGVEKLNAVVHYLRQMQGIGANVKSSGDPRLGDQLFYGIARWSQCHMVNGRGGFLNSDLSSYGPGRSIQDVRAAIVNPDQRMDRKSEGVTVITADQHTLSGIIRNEDNFVLILQTEDGSFHSLPKKDIAHFERSGHSFMPGDYEKKLSSKEIDDLVSYLINTGAPERAPGEKQTSEEE